MVVLLRKVRREIEILCKGNNVVEYSPRAKLIKFRHLVLDRHAVAPVRF